MTTYRKAQNILNRAAIIAQTKRRDEANKKAQEHYDFMRSVENGDYAKQCEEQSRKNRENFEKMMKSIKTDEQLDYEDYQREKGE